MIEIRLLGQFDLRLDGKLVEIPSRPAQSLLAYLALTVGVAHRRERLAGLIWPDIPEVDARRNLRRALWYVRKTFQGQAPLRADDITVAFDPSPAVWVDALALARKVGPEQTVDELVRVVSAYGGELLPGFYDEWIIVEREQLQALFEGRIKLLLDRLVGARRWDEVLEWGERWIALAVAPEPAYRALMVAYSEQGDVSGVGHTYQRCVEALSRDLGVEPSEETIKLFKRLSHPGQAPAPESRIVEGRGTAKQPPTRSEPGSPAVGYSEAANSLEPEGSPAEPPFKGLQFFDEADADLFFGREELTARLLKRLGISQGGISEGENLLVIVGASGSGKSSLARAGLAPAIRHSVSSSGQPGSDREGVWGITIITPSAHPLEALAASLTRQVESVTAAATLIDDMLGERRSLRLYLRKLPAPLFLIVDQMEELFTLCRDERERRAFIDNLLAAVEGGRCKVVLTLRADFYTHCAQFENLRAALASSQEYIGPMSAGELRRAIEGPARQAGCDFEAGLIDLILREAGGEPGSLPLLSHALLETWNRRQGRTLTLAGYAEAGGVHGAIARTAESLYVRLTPLQQTIARHIFVRLTELGEGVQDTRRRATPDELVLRGEDRLAVEAVLNQLVEARLLTTGEGFVEVAHEALIRAWPTLRAWLSEDRDGLRLLRHLSEAARSWEELDQEPGELYRGARLAQAMEWVGGHPGELNALEAEFLAASQALSVQEVAERESARQREMEAARRFAESEQQRAKEQSRAARKFAWLAAGLSVLLLAAVVLASFALQQRQQARAAALVSRSRELAAFALDNLDVDPERSILLALQAYQNNPTREAEQALHQSVQASRLEEVINTQCQWATRLAASIDGKQLAVTCVDPGNDTTKIWDRDTGDLIQTLPGGLATKVWPDLHKQATIAAGEYGRPEITFWDVQSGHPLFTFTDKNVNAENLVNGTLSPDWNLVAEALRDGTTVLSSLETGGTLFTFGKPGGSKFGTVEFSPDGKRLLGMADGSLQVWDIPSGVPIVTLPQSDFAIKAAVFSPYSEQLALGIGAEVKIVDVQSGDILLTLSGHTGFVQALRYKRDGTRLASAGADGLAMLWNANTGRRLVTLAGHTGALVDLVFIPGSNLLATSALDGTVRVWNISPAGEREAPASFYDPLEKVYNAIAYSPDGLRLVVSGGSTAGEVFDATDGTPLVNLHGGFGNHQGSAAFSPDGKFLATTSGENVAYLWETGTGKKILTYSGHGDWIGDLAFSPDGQILATISFDRTARIWEAASGKELFSVQAFSELLDTSQALGIEFSPDGSKFATAAGHTPRVWDARSGKELLALPSQIENAYSLAFSPDGGRLAIGVALGEGASTWDLATGQKLADFFGHQGSINAILFSRDGKQIFTGSVDGTIKVWDAFSGQEQFTLTRRSARITGLALSPDGTRLAASNEDGTARVYLLRPEDLIQIALQRLTRWFTPGECRTYLHTETCPPRP